MAVIKIQLVDDPETLDDRTALEQGGYDVITFPRAESPDEKARRERRDRTIEEIGPVPRLQIRRG